MWIVINGDKFLIEERPKKDHGESRCIPCGHIDLNKDFGNYICSALLRECQEEFRLGSFRPAEYTFLKTIDYDELKDDGKVEKLRLHYFIITNWEGQIPEFTIEEGEKHARLVWRPFLDYGTLPQSCDRDAIQLFLKTRQVPKNTTRFPLSSENRKA
jgi:8-oxo-dGTP pyrophosphatase MutT (NUDIX family)